MNCPPGQSNPSGTATPAQYYTCLTNTNKSQSTSRSISGGYIALFSIGLVGLIVVVVVGVIFFLQRQRRQQGGMSQGSNTMQGQQNYIQMTDVPADADKPQAS
jgi:hypothetical protein